MTPFEALYERKCRTPLCLSELDEALTIGPKLIQETTENDKENSRIYQSGSELTEKHYG